MMMMMRRCANKTRVLSCKVMYYSKTGKDSRQTKSWTYYMDKLTIVKAQDPKP